MKHATKQELLSILEWAKEKIQSGEEPPWSWYQYMKLIESLESILNGMDATTTIAKANLQQSDLQKENDLPRGVLKFPQRNAQHHQVDSSVQLPM